VREKLGWIWHGQAVKRCRASSELALKKRVFLPISKRMQVKIGVAVYCRRERLDLVIER